MFNVQNPFPKSTQIIQKLDICKHQQMIKVQYYLYRHQPLHALIVIKNMIQYLENNNNINNLVNNFDKNEISNYRIKYAN